MKSMEFLKNLFVRFRYPISLPKDIEEATGVELPNTLSFEEMIQLLSKSCFCPKKIQKFMPRYKVESIFKTAKLCERFCDRTLFSFCFTEGWIEFVLKFDSCSRLRRIYLMHKQVEEDCGIEIPLPFAEMK